MDRTEVNDIRLADVRLTLGNRDFLFDGEFPAGRITAVTGASGAGKSTLFNLISGFEAPQSGQIWLGGRDVTELAPAERPVSLIFQDNNLFAHLDLFTNVGLGISPSMRLTQGDRERVGDALARVGLSGFQKRLPGSLSGGERQRVAFARALVRDRPYLLLDEPFAALDPDLRRAMADLLKDLQAETGKTVLMISHDRAELEQIAHAIVPIVEGRLGRVKPVVPV
ncbi:thiamine ABC transporter ATP-binding protein [Rhizobium sp. PAMB 3182]